MTQYWIQIMKDIQFDSWSRAYTMFDILNEPDSYGLTWPVVGPLYHQVMTAGYKINPCASRWALFSLHPAPPFTVRGSFACEQVTNARRVLCRTHYVLTVAVLRRCAVLCGGHGSGRPGQQLGRR